VSRAEHEAYFRELLGDVDEPTAPFGLMDAWGDGSGIVEARQAVDAALAARLRESARRLGVSAASVFHVAWAQVLARASGREDVVFGTVLIGRMQGSEGSDRALGPFVNTLPVRVRMGADGAEPTVRGTHAQLTELLRHEHASLALAQRCSRVEAPAPLFTAVLNYRHAGTGRQALRSGPDRAPVAMQRIGGVERTNYPVTLTVDDRGEAFGLKAQVPASVGPERVCAMVHRALEGLVAALEEAPGRAVRHIEVLPPAERARVLEEWNATGAPYAGDTCVHELFEGQVRRTPGAVAVVFESRTLTYAQLNARANRLAHELRDRGVGPDVRVALCVERSPEMVVGLLAVLKAGGAYVPLDPAYPEDRLRAMLADSGPAVVLAQRSLAALLGDLAVPLLEVDGDASGWAGRPETDPPRAGLTPEHLAYVIYTSGSTGTPKGVMNAHRGVVNRLLWMQDAYRLGGGEAVLQKTTYSFDVSVWEFFWPLAVGARLVVARPGGHRDPGYLVETIRGEGVTTVHFVPSMLQLFLEHREVGTCVGLQRVVCSGEALPPGLVEQFHERLPGVGLYNLYGPTEAAVDVTAWRCEPGREGARVRVPLGRPIANTRVYVLDG
ncbi:MAG TPA: AMP-binding protein, partial [Longimicrobiaceae bacterium]|nr:AMP-binding protein [Longimicrobiaceae bacterium]